MTALQWFIFFLVVQIIHGLGTWKLYEKAGRKSWEAFIPVYNSIVLMKIINRPTWWTALLFIPIINLIMFIVVWVETLRSFGKNSTKDTLLGVLTLGFYIYYVNYFENVEYIKDRSLVAKTQVGDTISSLLYAIVVATLVHTYVMQPFTIPTSSLEKTLLVGDFLFVSKFHYGARTPKTAVALPMVHDSLLVVKEKSYLSWPQLPSFRFPGIQSIKRNDIVVFNWPIDTVYFFRDASHRHIDKPLDKRSNYVKRCVGLPGDNLSIKNGDIFINNKKQTYSDRTKLQFIYKVKSKNGVSTELIKESGSTEFSRTYIAYFESQEQIDAIIPFVKSSYSNPDKSATLITESNGIPDNVAIALSLNIKEIYPLEREANLTFEGAEKIKKSGLVDSIEKIILPKESQSHSMFPHNNDWSLDNFGPIYIPEANKTVVLNKETLPFYKRLITVYEGNKLEEKWGKIYINDKEATNYTFKQDYYWMMGDNRHNSEDSRYWGFVPFDHVVGKPVFIWWSVDPNVPWSKAIDKVRWDRLFCTVGGDGQPTSYFKYFLIALVLWFGYDFYKRKKAKKA
ncbi:signal peptidase I [Flavobacterium terrae]|uniref:Signal peptidase I n=1 Tax=Flavobacterium terrae TaxID=415425 RepID=A0A1M6D642_9FLAO|nr:signal peptidase I [Flavobacterium terrae]SHI68687.1 signal peptidase I [Flavobacterium terrae]